MAANEDGPEVTRAVGGAARSADDSTPITGSWAEHHGSPCSCGCEPVRGDRLSSILDYVRSQVSESPATRERREREARKVDGAA